MSTCCGRIDSRDETLCVDGDGLCTGATIRVENGDVPKRVTDKAVHLSTGLTGRTTPGNDPGPVDGTGNCIGAIVGRLELRVENV